MIFGEMRVVVSKWMSKAVFLLSTGTWAAAMVIVGALAVLEWPTRFGGWEKLYIVFGAVLVAAGHFLFAVLAGRSFPQASRIVKAGCELAPWVVLVLFLGGGLLW